MLGHPDFSADDLDSVLFDEQLDEANAARACAVAKAVRPEHARDKDKSKRADESRPRVGA